MTAVTIAGLNIGMDTADGYFLKAECRAYLSRDIAEPDLVLRTRYFDEIKKPEGEIIGQMRDVTIVRLGGSRCCRYLTNKNTGLIDVAIHYDRTYAETEIHLLKLPPQTGLSMADYEYLHTGFAFGNRLAELGGAVIHGSGIAYRRQGIIFSANCGTGKSTHTGLWKKHFPDKVTVVNDDKPAIRFSDGVPYMYGTPWSGKSMLHANMQVPLKAIVFIRQAEVNRIERPDIRDSIFGLMSQIGRPYYDRNLSLKTMAVIERLVQTVPVYRLSCTISREAVETVYQRLMEDGVIA